MSASTFPAEPGLPVTRSAIAGALSFGATFLAVFAIAALLGMTGHDMFKGLWALGACWALTVGGVSGALAAAAFNLCARTGLLYPGAPRALARTPA
jgi:hypothetical protein